MERVRRTVGAFHYLLHLCQISWLIKDGRIVVRVNNRNIHKQCGREWWLATVNRLHSEQVVVAKFAIHFAVHNQINVQHAVQSFSRQTKCIVHIATGYTIRLHRERW